MKTIFIYMKNIFIYMKNIFIYMKTIIKAKIKITCNNNRNQ